MTNPRGTWGSSWPTLDAEGQRMVEANAGLVGFALKRRGVSEEEYEDRRQDGMLGLIRAVQLFEPERGFKFSTYAMHWINQAIERGREVETGSGYRRSKNLGVPWEGPMSLDMEMPTNNPMLDSGSSYYDLLEHDDPEPADCSLHDALAALCRDQLDRDVLAAVANGIPLAAVARKHGVSKQTPANALSRLRSKVKHPVNRRLIEGAR